MPGKIVATLFCLFLLAPSPTLGQDKGSFFAHWGYNRAWFSWSDIHFDGPDHDFTLRHVVAKDRPVPLSLEAYCEPKNIWIPQYNYRVGWFFHDRWSISLGLDHMKYVVQLDQTVRMDGYANAPGTPATAAGEGSRDVILSADVLKYEHSDGLNLLSIDVDHYDPLWKSRNERQRLRMYEGIYLGPVIPRSDVLLFGEGMNNRFNIAGFGVGAQVGLHFTFLKHFYLRNALKAGWIDLPNVLTTGAKEDHANQHFWFVQHAIVLGGQFRFGGGKRSVTDAP